MTAEEPEVIVARPPSVDDVLGALTGESRIGRVDFSQPLRHEAGEQQVAERTPAPEPEPVPEPVQQDVPAADETAEEITPVLLSGPAAVADAPARRPQPSPEPEPLNPPEGLAPRPDGPRDHARPVGEVAHDVVLRMRGAQAATLRQLEALEIETARRCELLTAQAELDAELIRLHARREAHAIITAARLRAGERPDDDGRRLSEVGDALAHVSDATEAALSLTPPRADRREKP